MLAEVFAPYYEKHASKLTSTYQSQLSLRYWLGFHGEASVAAATDIIEQERFLHWLHDERGISINTSAQRIIRVGKSALNWAWKRGYLASASHVMTVKKKNPDPRGRPLQSVPAWEVAAQLGHKQSDVSTTEIYAPFDPAYLSNAVRAIDDFLGQLRVKER